MASAACSGLSWTAEATALVTSAAGSATAVCSLALIEEDVVQGIMLTLVDTLRSGDLVELRGVINANSVGGCGEGNEEGSGTHFD